MSRHVGIDTGLDPAPAPTPAIILTGGQRRILVLLPQYFVSVLALVIFPVAIPIFNMFLSNHKLITECFLFLSLLCLAPLVSIWIVDALIFSCERKLVMKRNKALYFVFQLKTSLFYLFSSTFSLLSWHFYIKPHLKCTDLIHHLITSTLVTFSVGSIIWILKVLSLKQLACQFHDKDLFEKMKHLISQEFVLQTLLIGTTIKFYTVCDALQKPVSETQVDYLFSLVMKKFTNGDISRDIREIDLLRFMNEEDVAKVLQVLGAEAMEAKIVSQTSLRNWMVKVCVAERKTLVDLLMNTSMAIQDLDSIIFMNLAVLLPILWFFLTKLVATQFLVFISSLLGIFFPISKIISEGIIFVFKMHWFDIGDCCIIDNQKMVVKDIGIFTTVFYKENNDIASYSNSCLATKCIENLSRSPALCEILEVYVTTASSNQNIDDLRLRIIKYIESKPQCWSPDENSLLIKEVAEKGTKYALRVTHAQKFENLRLNNTQTAELLLQLKTMLQDLGIHYLSIQ